jgi:ComF family protein
MSWSVPVRAALLDAWAVLLPLDCAGCESADRSLCPSCRAELTGEPVPHRTPDGTIVRSAVAYQGAVRRVMLAFKEQQRTDVAEALAVPLAQALAAAPLAEPVPVPTTPAAYRRRGYDPVRLVLSRTGRRAARVLVPARRTVLQKSLDIDGRRRNREGAFVARRPLAGRQFVIVDDILTTGATIDDAARAIRAAGGEVCGAVTIAWTPRRHPQ